jgi:hypothetical protein
MTLYQCERATKLGNELYELKMVREVLGPDIATVLTVPIVFNSTSKGKQIKLPCPLVKSAVKAQIEKIEEELKTLGVTS